MLGPSIAARVSFRRLRRDERRLYRAHLRRLTPKDRHSRFMGAVAKPRNKTARDREPWPDIVLGCFVDRRLRGAGELHLGKSLDGDGSDGRTAELAISVEQRFQNIGLGTALAERLAVLARNRGIGRIELVCFAGNVRMLSIARALGGRTDREGSEVYGVIELPPADLASFLQEQLEEGAAVVKKLTSRIGRIGSWPWLRRPGSRVTAEPGSRTVVAKANRRPAHARPATLVAFGV